MRLPATPLRGCGPSPVRSEYGPRRSPRTVRIWLRKQTRRDDKAGALKRTKTARRPSSSLFPKPVAVRAQRHARVGSSRPGARRPVGCLNADTAAFWVALPWFGDPSRERDASGWLMVQLIKIRPAPHTTTGYLMDYRLSGRSRHCGGRGPVGRGEPNRGHVELAYPRRGGASPVRSLTPIPPAPGPPPPPMLR